MLVSMIDNVLFFIINDVNDIITAGCEEKNEEPMNYNSEKKKRNRFKYINYFFLDKNKK